MDIDEFLERESDLITEEPDKIKKEYKEKSEKEGLEIKKTEKPTRIQTTCLLKNSLVFSNGVKLFMVTNPAAIIGSIKKTKSQSMPFPIFFSVFILI